MRFQYSEWGAVPGIPIDAAMRASRIRTMRENAVARGRRMSLKAALNRMDSWRAVPRIAMLLWCIVPAGAGVGVAPDLSLVNRALGNELSAAQDSGHPMQYRLRKSSPRLISTKQIVETRDGAVARLLT